MIHHVPHVQEEVTKIVFLVDPLMHMLMVVVKKELIVISISLLNLIHVKIVMKLVTNVKDRRQN